MSQTGQGSRIGEMINEQAAMTNVRYPVIVGANRITGHRRVCGINSPPTTGADSASEASRLSGPAGPWRCSARARPIPAAADRIASLRGVGAIDCASTGAASGSDRPGETPRTVPPTRQGPRFPPRIPPRPSCRPVRIPPAASHPAKAVAPDVQAGFPQPSRAPFRRRRRRVRRQAAFPPRARVRGRTLPPDEVSFRAASARRAASNCRAFHKCSAES